MNSPSRYRKSKYRKKRIKAILITSIIALVVLFIIFMSVGLSLSEKTKEPYFDDEFDDLEETDQSQKRIVQKVGAYPLPLLEDGSSFASRLAAIAENENAKSVCISLNKPDGTLMFRSSLASSLSYLSVASDASTLSTYIKSIGNDGLYATATLYIPSFNEKEDDLMTDIELSIWGSVACEAIRTGVGDVLLIANSATEEDVNKLCALAERIHITENDAVIGLTLPNSVLEADKRSSLIDTLAKSFDYLALDLTQIKGEGTVSENIESVIADMQLQLMYYDMRVLLPKGENAQALEELIKIVKKYNVSSWQVLPN